MKRNLWLFVLIGLVLAFACVWISLVLVRPRKVRVYPPQEIVVKDYTYHVTGKIEETLSFNLDLPDKDKRINTLKRLWELYDYLECKFGPVEIRENETFDEATRVVVPNLYMKMKKRATGEIITQPKQDGPKIADTILEKRETAEGPRWYIIVGPPYSHIASTWGNLPRKKVPDSATIILKKAIIVQVVSDDKVLSERTVFWNEDVASAVPQGLLPPHEIAIKAQIYNLRDWIEESLSFHGLSAEAKEKAIEAANSVRKLRQSLEQTLGPVEIRENETFDEATRVVVPILSGKERDRSTGKVKIVPDYVDLILEKQETAEGQQWRIISSVDPRYSEIKSTWLELPRKKVAGSPTIILKKAVVIQIVSDGEVVSERIVFYDE